ncbi:MAG TPA: ATPase [Methanobacterium subterraneum]|uniref:ATPase n=1 Tax=Methanobacterium subterraneum TaxID=59277 RepID=A0A7J4TFW1_9EURY|nr:MAG: ATPase [Methanobacteriales archaeon HGW-Methanobacteriales-2]HII83298.1 ATPase [Methanobacterium subterraneum]
MKLFEDKKIRTFWDENEEEWFFSIIDVIAVLTDSKNPEDRGDLKIKMKIDEGSELYENIVQLKMPADGKMRLTDAASTKQLLRLIQSIPSPKAEPFKL